MLPENALIVRHFPSDGNAALRLFEKNKNHVFPRDFLRCNDSHLRVTKTGNKYALPVSAWLKAWLKENKLPCFDRHVFSPHTRTIETGILLDLPNASWEFDFQLHERDIGTGGCPIPTKEWQKRYKKLMRPGLHHYFYTRMPDGESICDVCNRLRNFVLELKNQPKKLKHQVFVTHGDWMQSFRIVQEGISPDQYHAMAVANERDFRIGNGQILHYTRVDPNKPKHILKDRFGWVRSVNPWNPEYAGHDWRPIKPRRYSNAELLALVKAHKRFM